jgi:hypothetical protein
MAVKISRGGCALIFLGTGLAAYGLNRYGLLNLVRRAFRLGLPRSGKGRVNYRDTGVSNHPRPEIIAMTTPALRRETPDGKRSEKIQQRAHELYLQRGSQPGSALDDWLRAEAEILLAEDAAIDEASEESFPASDAPAY